MKGLESRGQSVSSSRKLPFASCVIPSFRASKRLRLILLLSNPTMKRNTISAALLFCGLIILCFFRSGFCRGDPVIRMKLGGVHNCKGSHNDAEIESLARFAVEEHNKKDNAFLEFTRLLRAKEQVVAGKVYYLTLEAMDAGKKKMFEAKVWVKPWMNFRQLQEFKHFSMVSPFTPSDLPGN